MSLLSPMVFAGACALPRVDTIHWTVPAHWVDGCGFEPREGNFNFSDLAFSSPNDGWIVGHPLLLHLEDEDMEMTFHTKRVSFHTIAVPLPGDVWAGGTRFREDPNSKGVLWQGVLWHYTEGKWQPVDLSDLVQAAMPEARSWTVFRVRAASPTDVWAILSGYGPSNKYGPSPKEIASGIFHFDGIRWQPTPIGNGSDRAKKIGEMCFHANGDGWAVGSVPGKTREEPSPLLIQRHGGVWREVGLEKPLLGNGGLNSVECLPDGRAVASGGAFPGPTAVVLRYDG